MADPNSGQTAASDRALLVVGKQVVVKCKGAERNGVIRYIGETVVQPGQEWIGVELHFPVGNNDGSVKGVQYFTCKPMFGIFVKPDAVVKEQRSAKPRGPKPQPDQDSRQLFALSQIAAINEKLKNHEFPERKEKVTTVLPLRKSSTLTSPIHNERRKADRKRSLPLQLADPARKGSLGTRASNHAEKAASAAAPTAANANAANSNELYSQPPAAAAAAAAQSGNSGTTDQQAVEVKQSGSGSRITWF